MTKITKLDDVSGTSLIGYLHATVAEVDAALGEGVRVNYSDGDKVTIEWMFSFEGHVFSIYDWKGSRSPLHIGGTSQASLTVLRRVFKFSRIVPR